MADFLFGTWIPKTAFPGIGVSIIKFGVPKAKAKSD
jgi:hypothetical protein